MIRVRRRKKALAFVILAAAFCAAFYKVYFRRHQKEHGSYDKVVSSSTLLSQINPVSNRFVRPETMKPTLPKREGFLSVDIWEEICGYEMESLKQFPLFPQGPSKRLRTPRLRLNFTTEFEDFGLRIFGFLSPKESGNYSFHVASTGTSELWISSNSKPENSKLIGNTSIGLTWKYSGNIPMLSGKRYYLDILLKHGNHDEVGRGKFYNHYLHVTWRSSSWRERDLREIPSDVFIAYDGTFDRDTGVVVPIYEKHRDPSFVNEEVQRRAEMYDLPFISENDSQNLFPPCGYNPSYLVKRPLRRYQSTWEMHYTSIYPFDFSDVVDKKPEKEGDFVCFGNDQLDENTAKAIASQVWTQIKRKHPG